MKCPVDDTELAMAERHGIEVDYCPKCRGVWLDRGELDKIIERAGEPQAQEAPARYAEPVRAAVRDDDRYRDERRDHRSYDDDYRGHHKHRRKKSFLGEIFDFD